MEQRDVAAMLGVRPATVGRWERDQRWPEIKLMPGVLMLLSPGYASDSGQNPRPPIAQRVD
ncbi:MAG: helix-turn-helix domain-containing protein [Deltaproteobacteria bacterium]|nr:helix-turn-helix domain-containing protein [Deltaproteobacteria bacterium]